MKDDAAEMVNAYPNWIQSFSKAALQRGAVQALQALAVKQHLQTGLVGERQHGTAQGLRRDIERQHDGLGRSRLRLRRVHGSRCGEQAQVNGQG